MQCVYAINTHQHTVQTQFVLQAVVNTAQRSFYVNLFRVSYCTLYNDMQLHDILYSVFVEDHHLSALECLLHQSWTSFVICAMLYHPASMDTIVHYITYMSWLPILYLIVSCLCGAANLMINQEVGYIWGVMDCCNVKSSVSINSEGRGINTLQR